MKPIDFRNETFDALRSRLNEDRQRVHQAWLDHGPGTTREVAGRAGIDLLSFRPRSTELFQIGAIELMPGRQSHEGIYQARTVAGWSAWYAEQREFAVNHQLQMYL